MKLTPEFVMTTTRLYDMMYSCQKLERIIEASLFFILQFLLNNYKFSLPFLLEVIKDFVGYSVGIVSVKLLVFF